MIKDLRVHYSHSCLLGPVCLFRDRNGEKKSRNRTKAVSSESPYYCYEQRYLCITFAGSLITWSECYQPIPGNHRTDSFNETCREYFKNRLLKHLFLCCTCSADSSDGFLYDLWKQRTKELWNSLWMVSDVARMKYSGLFLCVCKSSRRSLDTESFVWMAWGLHNLIYCELRHHHQSCFSIPAAASAAACENPEDHSSGWDRNADILWLSSRMLFFPEQCLHLVTVWFLYCVVVYVLLSLLGIRFKVLVDTQGASQASLLTFKIGQVGFSCFAVKYHKTLRCKHKVYTKRHLQSILNPLQPMNNQIIEAQRQKEAANLFQIKGSHGNVS